MYVSNTNKPVSYIFRICWGNVLQPIEDPPSQEETERLRREGDQIKPVGFQLKRNKSCKIPGKRGKLGRSI